MPPELFSKNWRFEYYYGPIDGHDTQELVDVLSNLREIKGPKILHVITKKGKGYEPAEKDEFSLHAVKPFDPIVGKSSKNRKSKTTYMDIFSQWILEKGEADKDLHAITPAMCSGSGLVEFSNKFPERYHDVGIAEQHAVTLSAGLAIADKKPVVAIYFSFLQRAYDQVIHDIALDKLNVLFAIDRAGIVGEDGATHNGSLDLSFLRIIPNMTIMAPSSKNESFAMLEAGFNYNGPVAVRYPRGGGDDDLQKDELLKIEIGKANVIREGNNTAILSFGALLNECQKASEELDATLVDMRFIKPLDENILVELSKTHKNFITVEDNAVLGGAGSAVNEFVLNNNLDVKVKNLGLPDKFLPHGTREKILADVGLNENGILEATKIFL